MVFDKITQIIEYVVKKNLGLIWIFSAIYKNIILLKFFLFSHNNAWYIIWMFNKFEYFYNDSYKKKHSWFEDWYF